VPARRPRSATAATRSRMVRPPSASARRSRHPPTLRACGAPAGCNRARPHPSSCIGSRRFRTSGRVFLLPLGRDGRTAYPSVTPVEETHPEAQSRRDRGISVSLRFRGARSCPVTPEVGAAASPPLPLPHRASTAARDTPQSGGRKRPPPYDVSRPSRRGPPRQRPADWRLRVDAANQCS